MKEMLLESDMDQLLADSQLKPVILLKHSTACPISANAYKVYQQFLNQYDTSESPVDCTLVKVIESRPASLYLSEKVGVRHQSPQILLIDKGQVIWHESHWQITLEKLILAVEKWEKAQ